MKRVIDATNQMAALQEQLRNTQMSSKKPESTKTYLHYLIENEKREQAPNFLQRIQGYNEAIRQMELQEQIARGNGKQDVQRIVNEICNENASAIIDSVEPGLYEKIRKDIFG